MSNSMWPHRRQPTRLPRPWDSPGKNTGVGCHFLLQCMKVKSESEVAQSCRTLCNPMDGSLPGSSVHGIFQARILEWDASGISKKYLKCSFQRKNLIVTSGHKVTSLTKTKIFYQSLVSLYFISLFKSLPYTNVMSHIIQYNFTSPCHN